MKSLCSKSPNDQITFDMTSQGGLEMASLLIMDSIPSSFSPSSRTNHDRNVQTNGNSNTMITTKRPCWRRWLGRCCRIICGYFCLVKALFVVLALLMVTRIAVFSAINRYDNNPWPSYEDTSADIEHFLPKRTYSQVQAIYHQDRPVVLMGTSDAYVNVNEKKRSQRNENMRQLEMIRSGPCRRFPPDYDTEHNQQQQENDQLDEANNHSSYSHWIINPTTAKYDHCEDGYAHKKFSKRCIDSLPLERFVCQAPHPILLNVTVTLERFGPFVTTGGYDWSTVTDTMDIGLLQPYLVNRNITFVGGLLAPVYRNGTIVSHPPIHIHHAHIYPYGAEWERKDKIHGSNNDFHDVMFQAHGDSECHDNEGGIACLLQQLDHGKGYVVTNSTTGISANFELNDVRPKGSSPMEYWIEIALLHTTTEPSTRSTFIGLNNKCVGPGPCTYMYPMDPHDNVLWYQYTHGEGHTDLPNGTMSDFILHTHQTIFDSAFLIRAPDDSVLEAFNQFAKGKQHLPLILDCHGVNLVDAKADLLSRIAANGGTVVCEATKPSVLIQSDEDNSTAAVWHAFDKRSQLNCLEQPVELDVGDRLVVLAFNTVHESKYTRQSHAFLSQNVFSDYYAAYQHTIFRFTLTYNDEKDHDAYVPPSWFYYAGWDATIGIWGHPDWWITSTCPASIKYRIQEGSWLSLWFHW